jgi:pimeloyl-ACP methyl ester carboxylesterase/DNA-binding CsgD family transcriptional regulator
VRFVRAADETRIAYAVSGAGPPLVRTAHWLSHLEFDWWSPVWRDFLAELSLGRRLVRYDQRGTGLSDREVADLSFEAMVGDLEALVDALELERFSLLGMSQGAAISVAYAARHPERVAGLVLCGGYARGHAHRGRTSDQLQEADVLLDVIRVGWGTPDPTFRRVFASMFFPEGSPAQYAAFDQLQRVSATPEVAYRLRRMFGTIDVEDLCPRVRTPTLVMHVRDDRLVPFDEGRHLAALIPEARFVPLEGRNHIPSPGEPAFRRFFEELALFLATVVPGSGSVRGGRPGEPDPALSTLTPREREVMALVAEGLDNEAIAAALYLSYRTIERHLSNIYAKLGVEGKAARAAAAARIARAL